MAHIRTISAKDIKPEEISQMRGLLTELPLFSPLRMFIGELLSGLELGLDMTLISEHPEK